jgi:tetratricopeptide (TPR) repeat protein
MWIELQSRSVPLLCSFHQTPTDDDVPAQLVRKGMELAPTERYEESIRKFDLALELRLDFPEALYSGGEVYIATGRYGEAIGSYERD